MRVQGRPKDGPEDKFRLTPVVPRLEQLLGTTVGSDLASLQPFCLSKLPLDPDSRTCDAARTRQDPLPLHNAPSQAPASMRYRDSTHAVCFGPWLTVSETGTDAAIISAGEEGRRLNWPSCRGAGQGHEERRGELTFHTSHAEMPASLLGGYYMLSIPGGPSCWQRHVAS